MQKVSYIPLEKYFGRWPLAKNVKKSWEGNWKEICIWPKIASCEPLTYLSHFLKYKATKKQYILFVNMKSSFKTWTILKRDIQ